MEVDQGPWIEFLKISDKLAMKNQLHKTTHTMSCRKYGTKECRFGFPKELHDETSVDEKGEYKLKRNHQYLNTFNPVILVGRKINHDIRFISRVESDDTLALLFYLTNYTTKADVSKEYLMKIIHKAYIQCSTIISSGNSDQDRARRILIRIVNLIGSFSEVSAQQAVSEIIGYSERVTNENFSNLNWNQLIAKVDESDQENSDMLTISISENNNNNNNDVFLNNDEIKLSEEVFLEDHEITEAELENSENDLILKDKGVNFIGVNFAVDYMYRGEFFENYNAYTYSASVYKQVRNKNRGSKKGYEYHPDHVQFATHIQAILKNCKIPNILGKMYFPDAELSVDEEKQFACKATLVVFKPWRKIADLKQEHHSTWYDSYIEYKQQSEEQPYIGNPLGPESGIAPWLEIRNNLTLLKRSKNAAKIDMEKRRYLEEQKIAIIESSAEVDSDQLQNELCNEQFVEIEEEEQLNTKVLAYVTTGLLNIQTFCKFPSQLSLHQDMQSQDECSSDLWRAILKEGKEFDPIDHDDVSDEDNANNRLFLENQEVMKAINDIKNLLIHDNFVELISEKLGLGVDQSKAFSKVVKHASESPPTPLYLFISGEAGTGKSKVISSIRMFFESSDRKDEYQICASTGTAASKLYASTVHSYLCLNISKRNLESSTWKQNFSLRLHKLKYLIIDEMSMIGSKTLLKIDQMLKIAKNNNSSFGGISLIVLGDFYQFSPVKDIPVYDPNADANKLWLIFQEAVILRENFRQKEDPKLLGILRNWKSGKMTSTDWDLLSTRDLSKISKEDQPDLQQTPIIVSRNAFRHRINSLFSNPSQKMFEAKDICKTCKLEDYPTLREKLLTVPDESLVGRLVVYTGMKVMLNSNLSTRIGLSKGSKGCVQGWSDDIIFFKSDLDIPVRFPGLQPNVVPIERGSCRFNFKNMSIRRVQFPIIPCYALTDYRSQGDTYKSAVIDLRIPPTGAWNSFEAIYVMLSRVSSLSGLYIIPGFKKIPSRPSEALLNEYNRLEKLEK
jgi:hypothetical protein